MAALKIGEEVKISYWRTDPSAKPKINRKTGRPKSGGLAWKRLETTATPVARSKLAAGLAKEQETEEKQGPVRIVGGSLADNLIGIPELRLKLRNNSPEDVVALEITAECYNRFEEKIGDLSGDHVFRGIAQKPFPPDRRQPCPGSSPCTPIRRRPSCD